METYIDHIKVVSVNLLLFMLYPVSSISAKIASLVERPGLKPNWFSDNKLWSPKCSNKLRCTKRSVSFTGRGNRDIGPSGRNICRIRNFSDGNNSGDFSLGMGIAMAIV